LEHIQIKHFFQNLLRTCAFSIFKVHTRLNPGDLNTKRIGGEWRRFLGTLIRFCSPNDGGKKVTTQGEESAESRATREQCVRLIPMANVTLGMCMQLKGCNREVFSHHAPVAGGSTDDGKLHMVCARGGIVVYATAMSVWRVGDGLSAAPRDGAVHWICDDVCCRWFCLRWTNGVESLWMAQPFAVRHAAWLMEPKFWALVKPSLWVAWWVLNKEIAYLHERYRESEQRDDFMVDVENVYGCSDEYLTDGNFPVGAGVLDSSDPRQDDGLPEAPEEEPFQGVDLAEAASNHLYRLNGRNIDQTIGETEADERANTTRGIHGTHIEEKKEMEQDDKMEVGETPGESRARYMSCSQEEGSDPDKWAEAQFGGLAWDEYERIAAFSRANKFRWVNALETLRMKRNITEVDGNWEEASNYGRAMAEVESRMDMAQQLW